ncbi:MAG TPA: hypothetical protein VM580_02290 [Labilithrix sp.]|nr:hypothetical protein [Labilithrix sp.]
MNHRAIGVFSLLVAGCSGVDPTGVDVAGSRDTLLAARTASYVVEQGESSTLRAIELGPPFTSCADAQDRPYCAIETIDFSLAALRLADESIARRHLLDGHAFVLGKLVAGSHPSVGRLVVTNVFLRRSAAPAFEKRARDIEAPVVLRGSRATCGTTGTCAWLQAEPLAGGMPTFHAELDGSFVGLERQKAEEKIARSGLVVSGGPVGTSFVLSATYEQVASVSAARPF